MRKKAHPIANARQGSLTLRMPDIFFVTSKSSVYRLSINGAFCRLLFRFLKRFFYLRQHQETISSQAPPKNGTGN